MEDEPRGPLGPPFWPPWYYPPPPRPPLVTEAPNTGQQPYGRNGHAGTWEVVLLPPTTNNTAGLGSYPSDTIFGFNPITQMWVPVQTTTGVTNGSAATAGQIGELIEQLTPGWPATTVPVSISAGGTVTYVSVVTITLSPGDWDVHGYITWNAASAAATAPFLAGFAALSTVAPPSGPNQLEATAIGLQSDYEFAGIPIVTHAMNVTSSTPVYVVTSVSSPTATDVGKNVQAWGYIHARRMR